MAGVLAGAIGFIRTRLYLDFRSLLPHFLLPILLWKLVSLLRSGPPCNPDKIRRLQCNLGLRLWLCDLVVYSIVPFREMDVPRCHTCQAVVQDTELRVHLRSAWHVYNLKRSIASLAPLSEAQFLKKQELLGPIGASGPDSILQDKEVWYQITCCYYYILFSRSSIVSRAENLLILTSRMRIMSGQGSTWPNWENLSGRFTLFIFGAFNDHDHQCLF